MKSRRGRRIDATGRSTQPGRFLQISHFLLSSPAWQSLSPIPRALYLEVAQRWTGFNNGHIGLGVRQAGEALHIKRQTVTKAFRDLIDRGFLVQTRDSTFNQKRLTREWRVTAFPTGDCRAPTTGPTNDFMRWRPCEMSNNRPPEKQKLGPFGGTHRAVSGPSAGVKALKRGVQGARSALSAVKSDGHRAKSGPPYSYQEERGAVAA